MKILPIITLSGVLSLSLASFSAAQAQSAPAADSTATQNPAVKSPKDMSDAPLAKGHNSFTKAQAADRIRSAGYTDVQVSALDADGLWQATATHSGQTVHVALDYKGNVGSQ
jgi:hypothetical protein